MAFDKATQNVFFGREAEVADLVRRLDGANFVPVIGASGSGKSSVVRAGLVPWVEAQGWQVLGPIKPGPEPLAELKSSFRAVFDNREIGTIYQLIETEGLVAVLEHLPSGQRYLLVVDQFEEVFAVCTDRDQQQRFIHSLTGLSQRADAAIKVVTTMRSDFVTSWLSSDPLTQAIQHQAVWLGTLRGEALRQAIVCPAETHGYKLENGLLELILDDVAQEENCLPLLEFALAELWQRRDTQRRVLTVAAYRNLGRLRGALSQRADALYQALKTDLERDWCRRLCLELVRIGPEGTDTRSRQRRQTLVDKGNTAKAQETIAQVLDTLVDGRLLVADRVDDSDTIDLAHEALMAGWPTFAQWRETDRDQLRLVQRLKDAHTEWLAKDRSDAYLVQGGLLAELRDSWAKLKTEANLAAGLTDFFGLSDDHEQQKVAALEKALAEAELRAECSRIANMPGANAVDKTLLTIKAVEDSLNALQGEVIVPVQDALHRAFTHPCEQFRLEGHAGSVRSVAFSPQGNRIVSGGTDRTLRLWDLKGRQIGEAFEGHSEWVQSVAFSPQGDRIVSGGDDRTLRLWDLEGRQIGGAFESHSGPVWSVAFSPQGERIISGGYDGTLRLWDLDGRQIGGAFEGHKGRVWSVAFSPHGDRIVSGGDDRTLCLWDLEGRQIGGAFEGHKGTVRAVAFSLQGDRIVSGGDARTLCLWDLEGRQIGGAFEGHKCTVWSVAFSPQGDRIVSGDDDGTLRLWDLEGRQIGGAFEGHSGLVWSVAFSPQGDCIVSGGNDGTLRLWDLDGRQIGVAFKGHKGTVWSVAFSPQGDCIVSGDNDGTLRLWDLEGQQIESAFEGHFGGVMSVAFSPQGDCIVSGGKDGTLRLWDLEGRQIGGAFEGHSGEVWSVAFSLQGDRIVSSGNDGTLRLWDLEGRQIGGPFEGHKGTVRAVAFSPQGDRIVSSGNDGTLRLWDLEGRQIGGPFEGHSGGVWSVAFSPQGDRIVSGGGDCTLRLWPGGSWQDWLHTCCSRLMHHPRFTQPTSDSDLEACQFCQDYVWTEAELAEFRQAQAIAQGNDS
jgi:WD40 repeat protein